MDERKTKIRELELKKQADVDARNGLFTGLGETLLQRIGEGEAFRETLESKESAVLADYRKLQKELFDSSDLIKNLEADTVRLKELEAAISTKEEEKSLAEKDLAEFCVRIGKSLFLERSSDDESVKAATTQEETLLAKIEEQEKRIEEIDEKEGGILTWLGKNAQMAVSRTILLKNRSALEKLYRSAGEKFLARENTESKVSGAAGDDIEKANYLKELLSSLTEALGDLKSERRRIGALFGAEGSPLRRIQGLERHIAHVKSEFPAVYLRLGLLAAENTGQEALSFCLKEEDAPLLKRAALLQSQIDERELEIEKIKTAVSIDNEKAEIEKLKKSIENQRLKISAAENAILDLEKHIAESEGHIEKLKAFLDAD